MITGIRIKELPGWVAPFCLWQYSVRNIDTIQARTQMELFERPAEK